MMSKGKNGKKAATPELTMRERVFQLRDQGMSSEQIGRQLGVAPTTIAAYLAHRTRGRKSTLRDQVFQLTIKAYRQSKSHSNWV